MNTASSEETRKVGLPLHGVASQFGHWGEIIQGPIRITDGSVVVGLVTLPRCDIFAVATAEVSSSGESKYSSGKSRAFKAARVFLEREGLAACGLNLSLRSSIPCGVGAGSSSADIIASIRATAKAIGSNADDDHLQRLCWEIEGASDPLTLVSSSRTAFYGSRCGRVIEWIDKPLPEMACLGFNVNPGEKRITDDVIAEERFSNKDVDQFSEVLDTLKCGITNESIELVGLAATKSAELRQQQFPLQRFKRLASDCFDAGAVGISISHSGVVAAALFSPSLANLQDRMCYLSSTLKSNGAGDIYPFTVGGSFNLNAESKA